MALPTQALPTATLTLGGVDFEVRGLSRAEALHFTVGFTEDAMPDVQLADRGDLAEVYLLVHGAGVTEEEATEWRQTAGFKDADVVLGKILELSGLQKAESADPQSPTSVP